MTLLLHLWKQCFDFAKSFWKEGACTCFSEAFLRLTERTITCRLFKSSLLGSPVKETATAVYVTRVGAYSNTNFSVSHPVYTTAVGESSKEFHLFCNLESVISVSTYPIRWYKCTTRTTRTWHPHKIEKSVFVHSTNPSKNGNTNDFALIN